MEFDILIIESKIVDGTGSPWYKGDIEITRDKANNPTHYSGEFLH